MTIVEAITSLLEANRTLTNAIQKAIEKDLEFINRHQFGGLSIALADNTENTRRLDDFIRQEQNEIVLDAETPKFNKKDDPKAESIGSIPDIIQGIEDNTRSFLELLHILQTITVIPNSEASHLKKAIADNVAVINNIVACLNGLNPRITATVGEPKVRDFSALFDE